MAAAVVMALLIVFVVRMAQHAPYSADSPSVRVSVAGGCPSDIGAAADVRTPAGPGFLSRLFHYPPLAPPGATSGLICEYGAPPAASAVAAPPSRPVQRSVRLTAAQAASLSGAVNRISTKKPGGESKCPSAADTVVIVVLGYPHHPDVDIWWDDSGCQEADNGYVQVFQAGNDSFGAFQDAVAMYLPSPA